MPVILYWGEEDFNLENSVKELKNTVLDDSWGALNHKKLDNPSMQDLIENLETTPMMFGNLLIEVNANNLFLRGAKKGNTDEKLLKKLITSLENVGDNLYVLLVCKIPRNTGKKIDSTKKITKAVKKIGTVEEFPAFKSYQSDKIVDWLINNSSKKQIKISRDNAKLLVEQVGGELRKLDIELEKLKLCAYPSKNIEKEHIQMICANHEDIFKMTDLWLSNKRAQAILELNKLFDRSHPIQILSLMQTVLKKWIRIKLESQNKPASEIASIMGLHPYIAELEIKKLRPVKVQDLINFRNNLTTAEYEIKSGKLSAELSLEKAIAS